MRDMHRELFEALDEAFDVRMIMPCEHESFLKDNPAERVVLFIGSGGVEGMVKDEMHLLPQFLTVLTDGKANSLAASMELCCYLRMNGVPCTMLHGSIRENIESLRQLCCVRPLEGCRIGVLGEPSDWLISSDVDYGAARERWGVEYVDIPLSQVEECYVRVEDREVNAQAQSFMRAAESVVEGNLSECIKALRLYRAIRHIVDEQHLDAVTIKCFDLIPVLGTTGCLALSILNDEGIAAGCEGDLQSVFTMLFCRKLLRVDSFMANPSEVDYANNRITLAHCTVGLKQTHGYIVRSHFESSKGIAIQGIMPLGQATLLKIGGRCLERYVVKSAMVIRNEDDPRKCRTQVVLQFPSRADLDYFLQRSIGNHHMIVWGDVADKAREILSSVPGMSC